MVTWDLLDEPWDALGTWTKYGKGTSEINPAGQLYNDSLGIGTEAGRYKVLGGGLPSQFTVETKLKVDDFATDKAVHYEFHSASKLTYLFIYADKILVDTDGGLQEIALVTSEGAFNIFRFVCDISGSSLKVYANNSYVGEFTDFLSISTDGHVQTNTFNGSEVHEDYLKIASGLHLPLMEHATPLQAKGSFLTGKAKSIFKVGKTKGHHLLGVFDPDVFDPDVFYGLDGATQTKSAFKVGKTKSSFKIGKAKGYVST